MPDLVLISDAFEIAAFELQQPGDYSIQTNIGWHIIQ